MASNRPVNPEALGGEIADHLNFFIDAALHRPAFAKRGKNH